MQCTRLFASANDYHPRLLCSTTRTKLYVHSHLIRFKSGLIEEITLTTKLAGLLNNYFYFFMSILIAVIVVFGFSRTVGEKLIHPTITLPHILYFHASIFSVWMLFFIFQSALVRTHNERLHRMSGWFGVALGVTIPVLGISTAVTMARFRILHSPSRADAPFILVPFFDIFAFTISFACYLLAKKAGVPPPSGLDCNLCSDRRGFWPLPV
jgi:hypothetical protein